MSFLKTLDRHFQQRAGHLALEFLDPPEQRLTYAELDDQVARCADLLRGRGVVGGDRVALQLPKSLEFILLHLATLRLGAISLPLNPAYPRDELTYFLRDSGACLFFADRARESELEGLAVDLPDLRQVIPLQVEDPEAFSRLLDRVAGDRPSRPPSGSPELDPDGTALMVYTSGTTGRPKGAEITLGNLTANLEALQQAWGWQAEDVLLHALPIFHVHGLVVALHGALHAGATTLLLRKFDPRRTLECMVERGCTVFMGVPTLYQRILSLPGHTEYDLSHMRLITSGSDRLPDELFDGFEESFGVRLLERYGMTETVMNISNPLHGERRKGSVGLPLPGVEARIADPDRGVVLDDGQVGEVQVRGPNVFKGYWRQPEKTAAAFTSDGWLHTGDLGYRSPDGYFTLKGRAKDLIITGGLNVYPPEVERVLVGHPAVITSAVIGCPDPEWGERVVAVAVLNEGAEVDAGALIAHCRERLAPYKCPREVHFRGELPRNAMGKVQKGQLRAEICALTTETGSPEALILEPDNEDP